MPKDAPALIVGLGYEPERSVGLAEFLDPASIHAFIPVGTDCKYNEHVLRNNEEFLQTLPDDHKYYYDINNSEFTLAQIMSLTGGLKRNRSVVLASLGPKLFSLICLIAAVADPSISVWRVSAGSNDAPVNAEPDLAGQTWVRTRWLA